MDVLTEMVDWHRHSAKVALIEIKVKTYMITTCEGKHSKKFRKRRRK